MAVQDRGVPTLFVIPLIHVVLGILLFISLLFGQRELTGLTLLIFGMIGGTKLWARASLKDLVCRLTVDKSRMFPGEKLTATVNAENGKILPVWLQLKVPVSPELHTIPGETILENEGGLLWYQREKFQWELTARRRGVHYLGPLNIFAGDIFAFFSRRKKTKEFHQIIVYPRLVPLKLFSLPMHDFFGCPGAKSPVQDPVYILGTRDYQHGRSAKYIHWKASARHERLQEKVFEPTKQEKILLVVDVEQFAQRNARMEFENTIEVVASLAERLDRGGHAVGLVTNGAIKGKGSSIVPIARGHRQLPAILETLARLEMKPRMGPTDLMLYGLVLTWGLTCVHFSYEGDGKILASEEYFTNRKTPVIFFVSRFPEEKKLPKMRHQVHRLEEIRFN